MNYEAAKGRILMQGTDDWLYLAEVCSLIAEGGEMEYASIAPQMVMDVIEKMATEDLIIIGELGDKGFVPWGLPIPQSIERIAKEWAALPNPINLGDVCWVANTKKGDQEAEIFFARRKIEGQEYIEAIRNENLPENELSGYIDCLETLLCSEAIPDLLKILERPNVSPSLQERVRQALRLLSDGAFWEEINGFQGWEEFKRFEAWLEDRIRYRRGEEVPVKAENKEPYWAQRWFKNILTQEIWRLVEPDPPFMGMFKPLSDNSEISPVSYKQ